MCADEDLIRKKDPPQLETPESQSLLKKRRKEKKERRKTSRRNKNKPPDLISEKVHLPIRH